MKHLKRSWKLVLFVLVVGVAGGVGWTLSGGGRAVAQVHGGYDPLTMVQRDAIIGVMDRIALDREALTALNVNAEQAETVVSTCRTWWEQNQGTLASLQATIDQCRSTLRSIRRSIRQGPSEEGQQDALVAAIGSLLAAEAAYDEEFGALRSAVNGELTESQRAAWASVAKGYTERMPIRLVDLTPDQRRALGEAWRSYRLAYAEADTRDARSAAVSGYQSALAAILTQEQTNVVGSYADYYADASQAVAEAMEAVLVVEDA